jgi:hypothetical protein
MAAGVNSIALAKTLKESKRDERMENMVGSLNPFFEEESPNGGKHVIPIKNKEACYPACPHSTVSPDANGIITRSSLSRMFFSFTVFSFSASHPKQRNPKT